MVKKQGQIQLSVPIDDAYTKSAQALNVIGASVTKEDRDAGRIDAKIPMSFTSWGEKLVVEIFGSDNAVSVFITSSSAYSFTLVDWGKNKSNVDRFLDWLRR